MLLKWMQDGSITYSDIYVRLINGVVLVVVLYFLTVSCNNIWAGTYYLRQVFYYNNLSWNTVALFHLRFRYSMAKSSLFFNGKMEAKSILSAEKMKTLLLELTENNTVVAEFFEKYSVNHLTALIPVHIWTSTVCLHELRNEKLNFL